MINKLQTLREARRKGESGFTIIEVLIVLAIAGLIMLIVFLAVPALQRNSRNTSRRSDASHLAGLVNEYAANHAGTLPTGLFTAATGTAPAGQLDISKEKWAIMQPGAAANNTTFGTTTTMNVNLNTKCDQATNALVGGQSNRTFSVSFQVESSAGQDNACING